MPALEAPAPVNKMTVPVPVLAVPRRAAPPRPPAPTAAVLKVQSETAEYLRERERLERQSVLRGLVWLALVAFGVSLLRAGVDRAFYAGWWRQW